MSAPTLRSDIGLLRALVVGVGLCWSNAGHPAPVLARADGDTVLLDRPPDRLLGVSAGGPRHDHRLTLRAGDTVVFYTDGLVEQRNLSLDEGTTRVVRELERIGREPLDRLSDELLAGLPRPIADDVALLAVRVPRRRPSGVEDAEVARRDGVGQPDTVRGL